MQVIPMSLRAWIARLQLAMIAVLVLDGAATAQICDPPRDAVRFRTADGRYLSAVTGAGEPTHGGYGLVATAGTPGAPETFFLMDTSNFSIGAGREVTIEVADAAFGKSGLNMRVAWAPDVCHVRGAGLVTNLINGLLALGHPPFQLTTNGCIAGNTFGGGVYVKSCCFSANDPHEWTFALLPGGTNTAGEQQVVIATIDGLGFVVNGAGNGALVDATALTTDTSTPFTMESVQLTNGGPVAGTVTDSATGTGLLAASVTGAGTSARTGPGGNFALVDKITGATCFRAGGIDLLATKSGFHDGKATVQVAPGSGGNVTIPLDRCAQVAVTTVDASDGSPVPGATVYYGVTSGTADPSGQLVISTLCTEGELAFSAEAPCYLPGSTQATVPHTGSASVEIKLTPDPACEVQTITFDCGPEWRAYKGFIDLGFAKNVCLTDGNPSGCSAPPAVDFGYAGSGWLAGSSWIWAPGVNKATTPAYPAGYRFSWDKTLPRAPTTATISVAADDYATIFVNNDPADPASPSIGSTTDATLAGQASSATRTYQIGGLLIKGPNNISITVENGNFGCGVGKYECNPAGLLCHGEIHF